MTGILPDIGNGALAVRSQNGVCLNPANVQSSYCPPPEFTSSQEITALPSDCNARISAAQINALASELLCFMVAINPTGSYNAGSVCNLAEAFVTWQQNRFVVDGETISGAGTIADPYHIIPIEVVNAICASNAAGDALAECLISAQVDNAIGIGSDGRLYLNVTSDAGSMVSNGDGTYTYYNADGSTTVINSFNNLPQSAACALPEEYLGRVAGSNPKWYPRRPLGALIPLTQQTPTHTRISNGSSAKQVGGSSSLVVNNPSACDPMVVVVANAGGGITVNGSGISTQFTGGVEVSINGTTWTPVGYGTSLPALPTGDTISSMSSDSNTFTFTVPAGGSVTVLARAFSQVGINVTGSVQGFVNYHAHIAG